MVEKEDGNLLVRLLAHVDAAVNPFGRLVPIHLARRNREAMSRASVAVFDGEGIATEDRRDAMKRIAMPRRALAGPKTANQRRAAAEENFAGHG